MTYDGPRGTIQFSSRPLYLEISLFFVFVFCCSLLILSINALQYSTFIVEEAQGHVQGRALSVFSSKITRQKTTQPWWPLLRYYYYAAACDTDIPGDQHHRQ